MNLLEICDRSLVTVPLEASAEDAVRQMIERKVGAVLVLDADGVVAGIFTERDALTKLALSGRAPATVPVRELMTGTVEMATESTSPFVALSVMMDRHYRHLPIVDAAGKPIGMLSIRDALDARIDDLYHELETAKSKAHS